jgi:hypothetical protein
MAKKKGGFLEQHIEKVVLAAASLLFLWLGFTRGVMTPNRVSFNNKQFAPAEIDLYVHNEAKSLADQLESPPESAKPYEPKVTEFVAALGSTVDIDTGPDIIIPFATDYEEKEVRTYRIPAIGEITDVAVEHIRAVMYEPTVPIDEQNPYSQERSAPNDIDLVTVEVKFDVAQLHKDFHESFAGEYIPEQWRDPCLARPVFGAVELQRQQLLEYGSWGKWQTVPRGQVEPYREMLTIVEDTRDLPPGGMRVRLLQFARTEVLMALLQPDAYRVASSEEEWFPPTIHKKYAEFQRKAELEEKRKAQEAERKQREGERNPMAQRRRSARRSVGEEGEFGGGRFGRAGRRASPGGRFGRETGRRGDRRSRSRSRGDEDDTTAGGATGPTSVQDLYTELKELLITREADLSKMREPLLIWAHDDTVEPGNTYRYRIRLGVLNPIAPKNWFSDQDRSLKNKAILWSKPSQVTEQVSIPKRLYFFPLQVAEASKTVNVQIATYQLGYWYSKSFQVRQGEAIGRVVENYTEAQAPRKALEIKQKDEEVEYPDRIDYSTGVIMVDVTPVNGWLGGDGRSLRSRQYFDMIYTIDGSSMAQMPVEPTNWPTELKVMSSEIRRAVAKTHKRLRGWREKIIRRLPAAGAADEYEDEDEDEWEGYMGM